MPTDPAFLYALTFGTDLTQGEVHDLLARWTEGANQPSDALMDGDRTDWAAAELTARQTRAVEQAIDFLPQAREAIGSCELAGLSIVTSGDRRYPRFLADLLGRSRPPLLFCAGNLDLLGMPAVSMIGSRKPPEEALTFTAHAAEAFAERGLAVVSGFAQGIDQCASRAALEAGGSTILFLAQGLLTFGRERDALSPWLDDGRVLAISAFEPRADWQTPLAMSRNAMITALSLHVVVGQAGLRGGTWEAARGALRQGRRVWVRRDDSPALGHQKLVSMGARAVDWPPEDDATFAAWADGIANDARLGTYRGVVAGRWSEEQAVDLLRHGSAADIHDATGMTGQTLVRVVEGRDRARIERIADLEKIPGIGPGTARQVREALNIREPGPSDAQLALFPEVSEFPGWDGDLARGSDEGEAPPPRKRMGDLFREIYDGDPGEGAAEEASADTEEGTLDAAEGAQAAGESAPLIPELKEGNAPREAPHIVSRPRVVRRNLLLVTASGLRADMLGCMGNAIARTPHLDALAWRGVRCTRAYTTIPREAPARASLLAGVSHRTHGLWANGLALNESTPSLAGHLAAQGYRTAFTGEMHFAPYDAPATARSKESIDYWRSGVMDYWGGPYHGFNQVRLALGNSSGALETGHYGRWLQNSHPSRVPSLMPEGPGCDADRTEVYDLRADPGTHVSGWIARNASRLIGEMCDTPFFLACSFPMPHAPYRPLAEDMQRFRPEDMAAPVGDASDLDDMPPPLREAWGDASDGPVENGRRPSPQRIARVRAAVHAMAARIDTCVGRILRTLDELGLAERTLVVFVSDHGDLLGDHGLLGCGPWHYEGLVRVPMIWNLPGFVEAGRSVDTPVSLLDFVPTALELIGVEPFIRAQGVSLARCLTGEASSPRQAALIESPCADPRAPSPRTVVTADRKMTVYPGHEFGAFFNLSRDGEERVNRFEKVLLPERLEMMNHLLGELGRTDIAGTPPEFCN